MNNLKEINPFKTTVKKSNFGILTTLEVDFDLSAKSGICLGEKTLLATDIYEMGDKYFYFNEIGKEKGFDKTIYKINNRQTADEILNSDFNFDKLKKLVENQQLTDVKHKEVVEARTIYDATAYYITKYGWLFWVFLAIAIILSLFIPYVYFKYQKSKREFEAEKKKIKRFPYQ